MILVSQPLERNRYAITVIDHFSKFAAAYPVADKSAETVARVIFIK